MLAGAAANPIVGTLIGVALVVAVAGVIAALIIIVLTVVAIPAGRRLLRARLAPVLSQVVPRLLATLPLPKTAGQTTARR